MSSFLSDLIISFLDFQIDWLARYDAAHPASKATRRKWWRRLKLNLLLDDWINESK